MATLVLFQLDEHENGHAPDDAFLDGFVELGRFLLKPASSECYLGARAPLKLFSRGMFTHYMF